MAMLGALANRIPWLVLFAVVLSLFGAGFIGARVDPTAAIHVPFLELGPPPAEVQPSRSEWRQEQDLLAQWDQSRWAQIAAVAGLLSALITAVGIYFVRATLEATREATQTAQNQARVALESNALMRAAYVTEQRPWLKLEMAIGGDLRIVDSNPYLLILTRVTNLGRTPALLVWPEGKLTDVRLARGPDQLLAEAVSQAKSMGNVPIGLTMFPGEHATVSIGVAFSDQDADALVGCSEPLQLKVGIAVRYRSTLSDETYVTGRCADVIKLVQDDAGGIAGLDPHGVSRADGLIQQFLLKLSEVPTESSYAD